MEFKIGDKVVLVGKFNGHPGWVDGYMDQVLDEQLIGTVTEIDIYRPRTARVAFEGVADDHMQPHHLGGWTYPSEFLAIAKGNTVKKKAPKPKKISTVKKLRGAAGGLCSWAIVYKDGKDRIYDNQPCHAQFRGGDKENPAVRAIEALNYHIICNPADIQKQQKFYILYLLNRSPWKDCYKTKTWMIAMRNGVDYNVDMPHGCLLSAAVILRRAWENISEVKNFYFNVHELKMEENIAFAMAHWMHTASNWKVTGFHGGHHTLMGQQEWNGFKNFFIKGEWNKAVGEDPFSVAFKYMIGEAIAPLRKGYGVGDIQKKSTTGFVFENLLGEYVKEGQFGDFPPIPKEKRKEFVEKFQKLFN